jgi:hypothetical protein
MRVASQKEALGRNFRVWLTGPLLKDGWMALFVPDEPMPRKLTAGHVKMKSYLNRGLNRLAASPAKWGRNGFDGIES